MKVVVAKVMEQAEISRIGSKNAGFDRFHLVGLSRFAFHCYSAVFRQALFVRLQDWEGFWVFYITNALTSVPVMVMPMNGKWHRYAMDGPFRSAIGRRAFSADFGSFRLIWLILARI